MLSKSVTPPTVKPRTSAGVGLLLLGRGHATGASLRDR